MVRRTTGRNSTQARIEWAPQFIRDATLLSHMCEARRGAPATRTLCGQSPAVIGGLAWESRCLPV